MFTAPSARALLALIATHHPHPGDTVVLPGDLPGQLGMTDRGLRLTLTALEAAGVFTWQRKRPGRPAKPGYTVEVLDHPVWCDEVAA